MNLKETLNDIYSNFKDNQSIGIDGVSKQKFDTNLTEEIDTIERKILNCSFDFSYYKEQLIIKGMNKTRQISIPTLRDKLVLKYLLNIIKEDFDEELKLVPSIHTMIHDIKQSKSDFDCYIKVDIQNFFPSINHKILENILKEKISDELILNLIKKAIKQSTVNIQVPSKDRVKYNNKKGLPQGLSISGTLADIYLMKILEKYTSKKDIKFYKFVDDVLILCNKKDLASLLVELRNDFKKLKLSIHNFDENTDKSTYGTIEKRFDFLGYKFENKSISVRDLSTQRMFKNLSTMFYKYKNNKFNSKSDFYNRLNIKITGCIINKKKYGWIHFFSFINDYNLLYTLDKFVENNCKKEGLDYKKVKKFSRAIFEIKNPKSNYLINSIYKLNKKLQNEIILDLESDLEFY